MGEFDMEMSYTFEANAVGSEKLPKSSVALFRSTSLTFSKSKNRTLGHRHIIQWR